MCDAHRHLASDREDTDPAPLCGCTARATGDDCVPCDECERIIHQDETAHVWNWPKVVGLRSVQGFICDECYRLQPSYLAGVEAEARLRERAR